MFETEYEIVEHIKSRLYTRLRFLALPLGMLEVSFSEQPDIISTDGETLAFNPRRLRESFRAGVEEPILFILHPLYHCLLGHPWQVKKTHTPLWDFACDLMVWHLIGETYGEYLPAEYAALGREASEYAGGCMTAEELCARLEAAPPQELPEQFRLDDHRPWAAAREWEENRRILEFAGTGQDGRGAESPRRRWQTVAARSLKAGKQRRREAGTGERNLRRRISLEGPRRIGYRDFLKRFSSIRETAEINSDEFQYSYYLYGLERYGNVPIIEPLEYQERLGIEELGIVIDTSSSCSQKLTKIFLEETRNIIMAEKLFFRRFNLHIIQCDNRIQRDDRITCEEEMSAYIRDLEIRGHGGTDFRPAFDHIDTLRREGEFSRLKGVLYFTDGCGLFPAEMPEYETAFVFVKDRYDDIDVPAWALKLVLKPGQA
jgi:predicted metal-dependent peptidase